jgi:hypothetical protein
MNTKERIDLGIVCKGLPPVEPLHEIDMLG